eukprot:scaffold431_cov315-Prasinococcus_capsulatus_cf.AAC.11
MKVRSPWAAAAQRVPPRASADGAGRGGTMTTVGGGRSREAGRGSVWRPLLRYGERARQGRPLVGCARGGLPYGAQLAATYTRAHTRARAGAAAAAAKHTTRHLPKNETRASHERAAWLT